MQKVLELVVHEPMSQREEVRGTKEESKRMVHCRDERQAKQSFWRKILKK